MGLKAVAGAKVIDSPTFTGVALFASGSTAAPSIAFSATPALGWRISSANDGMIGGNNTETVRIDATRCYVGSGIVFGWSTSTDLDTNAPGTSLGRVSDGVMQLYGSSTAVGATLRRIGGNAGYVDWGSVSENLTLSTGGTTTDTAADLLPANSYIETVTARITTTIATATNWAVGDPTTAARFNAANATLTAGTTSVGLVHFDIVGAGGPRQTAAAKVRITTTGTPSAGAIRLTSYYRTYVAPTS